MGRKFLIDAIGGAALVMIMAGPCVAAPPPVIALDSGRIAGEVAGDIVIFRGIPYAAPPVGELRWRMPKKAAPWAGVRDAAKFGLPCPQASTEGVTDITRYGGAPEPTGEDCLTLNVWAPAHVSHAPVMVWIHGGSGKIGAGSLPFYDGSAFARDGVVLVTVNYRLGHLGSFIHPTLMAEAGQERGAFAMMDQIAALEWVKRNIAAFGGNPGNVTIAGESWGGISVLMLATTPVARGLFHKAIVESGGGWYPPGPTLEDAEKRGEEIATTAGAPPHSTSKQLRALPAKAVAKASGPSASSPGRSIFPEPVTLAIAAGHQATVPLLIGVNDGEDSLLDIEFSMKKALAAAKPEDVRSIQKLYGPGTTLEKAVRYQFRDGMITAPARWVAAQWSRVAPVYLYRLEHVDEARRPQRQHAAHGDEIFYVFKTLDHRLDNPPPPTIGDQMLADQIHARWVAFVKNGTPNVKGVPAWPAYSKDSDPWMVFGQNTTSLKHNVLKPQLDHFEDKITPMLWLLRLKNWWDGLFGS